MCKQLARVVTTAILCAPVASCDREPSARPVAPSASATVRPSACAGREVVSLVAAPRVLRGTVKTCAGQSLTIAYGHPLKSKPRPERTVDAATTWDVGKPAEANPGDVGACHYGRDLWKLCKVDAAEGGRLRVQSPEGQIREIDSVDMLVIDGASGETVREHLSAMQRQRSFDTEVQGAVFYDGQIASGEAVVAPRVGLSFFDATVVAVNGDRARVRWKNDDAWPERDVPIRQLGRPVTGSATLLAGQIVLWRAASDEERYEAGKVVSFDDGILVVTDARGERRTARHRTIVPSLR